MSLRRFISGAYCVLLASAFMAVSNLPTGAQDVYPSKVIHLVVTTAAGGADDFVARTVGQRLSASMGQPVIIENQPAGNGSVAAGRVARAPADGYTLNDGSGQHAHD